MYPYIHNIWLYWVLLDFGIFGQKKSKKIDIAFVANVPTVVLHLSELVELKFILFDFLVSGLRIGVFVYKR